MDRRIRVLILEDNAADAELVQRELRKAGLDVTAQVTPDKPTYLQALDTFSPDLILADYSLPGFDGLTALSLARQQFGEIPVIIVSGAIGEETAIEALKAGATDYVLKQRLGRLGPVVKRSFLEAKQLAEKRQAETELARQREWLRVTLTSIGDAVIAGDNHGQVTFLNPVAEALIGWSQAEAMGQPVQAVFRILNERTHAPADDIIARVLRDGRVVTLANDTALVTRDGRMLPIEDSAAPITDSAGQLLGLVIVFHDVTEKRRAQEALRENEERFRSLVDGVTEYGIFMLDPDGRVASWNAGAERIKGYRAGEIMGQPFACFYGPEDCAQGQPAQHLREAARAGRLEVMGWRIRKDGSRFWAEVLLTALRDGAGSLRGFAKVIRDTTERTRAEETLRSSQARLAGIVGSAMDAIISLDADHRVVLFNAAAERMFGCPAAEALGQPLDRFLPARYRDRHRAHVQGFGATGITTRAMGALGTLTALRATGQEFPIEASISQVDVMGQKLFTVILRDLTDRHQAEAALQQAHAELERRVQERTAALSTALQKGAFQSEQLRSLASELTLVEQRERSRLAVQIHDGLQQLLVAAKLRATLVGRTEDPRVRQGCEDIGRLLDDALADARSLTAELSPPVLRSGGLLAGLDWLARWSQEKHHLAVQVQAPAVALPPLPEDLTVLLFQSVRELLFNIVKYAGVPEAVVHLVCQAAGLTLTVIDTGTGFDTRTLRGEGALAGGFGLARIRHRLELLGGCMEIKSAPGQGSRVTLAIPLPTADRPSTGPAYPQSCSAGPAKGTPGPGGPGIIRVLLADDHQVIRQALSQLIDAEADLEVVGEAGTGTAAVDLAHQVAPDVVLMDVNMPQMNGIEATQALHADFPALRVIGLSMYDRGDQEAAMRNAGAAAYLSKSAPAEALLAAIRGGR